MARLSPAIIFYFSVFFVAALSSQQHCEQPRFGQSKGRKGDRFLESRKVQESTAPIAILRFDCRDKPLTTTISAKSFTERGQGKQEADWARGRLWHPPIDQGIVLPVVWFEV